MTANQGENIQYKYNTQGLVTEVHYNNIKRVAFFYDERGQRVKKISYNATGTTVINTDYYIRDLSGNVMSIYNSSIGNNNTISQTELPIYGGSRLGVYTRNGTTQYQITDHLGNVRAVIEKNTQNPLGVDQTDYSDYYPFGEKLPMRNMFSKYRYAFQGQELDPETGKEAFQLRLWDGRIGRWLTTDPYSQFHSPYLGMGNDPINGIDPDEGWIFGLFGSTADERALRRAERFAAKTGGEIQKNYDANGNLKSVYVNVNGGLENSTTYTSFGDFSSLKNTGETFKWFDAALSGGDDGFNTGGSYGGINGMRKFSKEASHVGDALEHAGLAASATGAGSVVGVPMVAAGGVISGVSTFLDITADLSESDLKNAGIKSIGELVQGVVGNQIEKNKYGKALTNGTKLIFNKTVDEVVKASTSNIHNP